MSAPLVLLHGFTGSPASWDELVTLLPAEARVIRETLVGHGAPELDTASDFFGEVDRIAARLAAGGVERAHLVGYSLGARIGLGLLARHGHLFRRATLVGVHPGLGADDVRGRQERAHSDERWIDLLETRGLDAFVHAWERQSLFGSQAALDEAEQQRQRAIRLRHRPEGLARSLRAVGLATMPDLRPSLPGRLPAPGAQPASLLLVVGEHDHKFRRLAEEIAQLVPRARLRLVPHTGHNVLLEQPRTLAAAILTNDADDDPRREEQAP